jgi:hypothetical protein
MMAAILTTIQGLENKQPLFREFCKINGLGNGCSYKTTDYLLWVDRLSLAEQIKIIRKYQPDFKMKNCNL